MHKQNTTNEHQIETITKSPESIPDVAQPLRVTSIMPLVITLPGKLPNILKIALNIVMNIIWYQSVQLMTNRNQQVLKGLPPFTLHQEIR